MATTIFVVGDGGDVVTTSVESTRRSCLDVEVGHGADAYYLDLTEPSRPRWALSAPNGEGLIPSDYVHKIPPAVRDEALLWYARWAGQDCAREWHEQEPGTVPRGWDFRRWRAEHGGLPADGDVEFLADGIRSLVGREPTDEEAEVFADALLEHLWDLTPLESEAD